ncbi:autotransporter assembly complex protein TamA [Novosphingobium terrae]|uniref:autotransporter assembly complex protein TamA n=1 Tax=Novosphingobium terrae TaxID=2726189 RepID=UPI001F133187|nr:BamA/TamA family outer membrane protein [Novosphingobium terrae]
MTASLIVLATCLATPVLAQTPPSQNAPAQQAQAQAGAAQSNPIPTTPILPDKDFDAALPPISDNPDAPMGTVQDWAKQQAPAATSAQPAQPGATTAQDGTLAPLPAPDPDLAKPLTPLDSFNTEPLVTAADVKDKPETELRYDWKVTGVDKLSDRNPVSPIDGNAIRDQFSAVSALKEGKGKAANGAMISARMQQDQKTLADVMSSQGYFDASVHGSVETPQMAKDAKPKQADQESGKITVTLDVAPGPRYVLGAIKFDTPPVTPSDLITRSFVPKSGEPIVADRILSAEASLGVVLPENGYPFVKVGQRDILLDAAAHTGDYTLPITPGPRSRFGDIVVEGKKRVFKPKHVATIARFKKGELYDSRKVDDLRKALVATNLYSVVTVEPQQTGQKANDGGADDGTEYANLLVNEQAGPPRSLSAQVGYATGEGMKATGSWTHANLFPPEGALIESATLGTNEQGISSTFRRSNAGKRDRTFEMGIGADHSNLNAYEAYTGKLYGRMSYASTPLWQKRWTYSYGFEVVGTNEQDYDFQLEGYRRRTFYILALPGQITYDRSNSLLDPTKGYKLSVTISPETSLGTGGQVYARDSFEATGYWPISKSLVLAGRAKIASIQGVSRESLAPSRRLYSGGGGSVRGFGYQELGPKDPNGNPIGGLSQIETGTEVRYRFGNYGLVAFVDGGQVYTSTLPSFTNFRLGAGIGARLYTNFGPLRFDIATPIHREVGESRIAVYVSIGQAF